MTDALLTLLRLCLLGLLYLFFFRVLQATWAGSRPAPAPTAAPAVPQNRASAPAAPKRGGRRQRAEAAAPSGPMRLFVLEPPQLAGREYVVNGELTIGRAASCHITLDDTYISQLHTRVSPDPAGVAVEDLGSTNGTYLNRQRVTSKVIGSKGDRIQLGSIVLELR
ncbi:MAG: FHA domain-containing protein [Actinomycetota bacterium]